MSEHIYKLLELTGSSTSSWDPYQSPDARWWATHRPTLCRERCTCGSRTAAARILSWRT